MPVTAERPSGWKDTRSPILNSSIRACARIWCRNLSRSTIRVFRSMSWASVSRSISKSMSTPAAGGAGRGGHRRAQLQGVPIGIGEVHGPRGHPRVVHGSLDRQPPSAQGPGGLLDLGVRDGEGEVLGGPGFLVF